MLLAKQAVTKRGSNCFLWQPAPGLVKDVADSSFNRCYHQRLQAQRDENSVTVTVFDEAMEDPPIPSQF